MKYIYIILLFLGFIFWTFFPSKNSKKFISGINFYNNDLIIESGQEVEIQPGSKLFFSKDSSLLVYGRVKISGTSKDRVFIGPTSDSEGWQGVKLIGRNKLEVDTFKKILHSFDEVKFKEFKYTTAFSANYTTFIEGSRASIKNKESLKAFDSPNLQAILSFIKVFRSEINLSNSIIKSCPPQGAAIYFKQSKFKIANSEIGPSCEGSDMEGAEGIYLEESLGFINNIKIHNFNDDALEAFNSTLFASKLNIINADDSGIDVFNSRIIICNSMLNEISNASVSLSGESKGIFFNNTFDKTSYIEIRNGGEISMINNIFPSKEVRLRFDPRRCILYGACKNNHKEILRFQNILTHFDQRWEGGGFLEKLSEKKLNYDEAFSSTDKKYNFMLNDFLVKIQSPLKFKYVVNSNEKMVILNENKNVNLKKRLTLNTKLAIEDFTKEIQLCKLHQ